MLFAFTATSDVHDCTLDSIHGTNATDLATMTGSATEFVAVDVHAIHYSVTDMNHQLVLAAFHLYTRHK